MDLELKLFLQRSGITQLIDSIKAISHYFECNFIHEVLADSKKVTFLRCDQTEETLYRSKDYKRIPSIAKEPNLVRNSPWRKNHTL